MQRFQEEIPSKFSIRAEYAVAPEGRAGYWIYDTMPSTTAMVHSPASDIKHRLGDKAKVSEMGELQLLGFVLRLG